MVDAFVHDILSPQAINITLEACWCELRGMTFSKFCPAWYADKVKWGCFICWAYTTHSRWDTITYLSTRTYDEVLFNGHMVAWVHRRDEVD